MQDILGDFELDFRPLLSEDELLGIICDYDALIIRSQSKITQDILERAKKLLIIGVMGVGLDNVCKSAKNRGIAVVNSKSGNTISASEHTLALMLSLSKNIANAHISMQEGAFIKDSFANIELHAKTLGIIGLGRIGSRVAMLAQAFGMRIIAHDPFLSALKIKQANERNITLLGLKELLKRSDILTLHVPKTPLTSGMIGKEQLDLMKKNALIINAARGGIVDECALKDALDLGKIAGAALDTHEFENKSIAKVSILKDYKNVILTPHIGAATHEAKLAVTKDVCTKIKKFLKGRPCFMR